MPTFAPKYTDAQRAAILSCVIDGGRTARQAIEAAAAGQLAGLARFDMPLTTARDLCGKERVRRREAVAAAVKVSDPRAAARELAHGMLERLTREWTIVASTPGNQAVDTGRMRELARAAKEALALAHAAGDSAPALTSGEADAPAPGLLERLAADAAPGSPNPPHSAGGEQRGSTGHATEKESRQAGKRVLVLADESAREAARALLRRT